MNRVRLLPEQVANQIAAGEVVERPASVVKELVENAIDAKSTRISVEIVAAGRGLIRVSDDGVGMSRDDALLCLERHATSKIAAAADLTRVMTLGFRGEAIPSIASVSRFSLTTRERETGSDVEAPGTQIIINGGRIQEVNESGAAAGTTVEVRSLFFNVPARRKFLRSDETERSHIQHWLTTAALAHPGVAFSLTMEGRTIWQLPALPDSDVAAERLRSLRERLRWLLGDGVELIPLDSEGEMPATRIAPADTLEVNEFSPPAGIRIWGWMGAPGVSRGSRDDQHLFVNRRPIDNRGLNAALVEGYHNALMKGRYPVACLFLELDPSEVDVNIHPAKREVKFHRERAVRHFVAEAVRDSLRAWHQQSVEAQDTRGAVAGVPAGAADRVPQFEGAPPVVPVPSPVPALTLRPEVMITPEVQGELSGWSAARLARPDVVMPRAVESEPVSAGAPFPSPSSAAGEGIPSSTPRPMSGPEVGPAPLLSIPLRIVGVVGRLYVVLESDRGLVLLDQHAAHERVLYEQMLRRGQGEGEGAAPSQRLLLPETLELSPKDAAFLRENLETLSRLGVGLSEFGERTFLLDALPPFVKASSPRRFALELVDELRAAGASVNLWRLGEAVVAKTVCRHSVKANDPLTEPELAGLLESLRRCDMPYTCPHGRPTLIEMSFRELEKRFGRVPG
ncbi:MAG: DNA mismatch repair endonuclease MutL [Verrucomicrobiales bacterium]|nr:DNA mismatch repair endonuclease MutL [Verrucomicrobiales bacterium]